MKFYIATRFSNQSMAVEVANTLAEQGHSVTAHWLAEEGDGKQTGLAARDVAQIDLHDIHRSDALLLLSHGWDGIKRGGMWVEFGFALALGKKMYLMGPMPSNIFCFLPHIRHIKSTLEIIT